MDPAGLQATSEKDGWYMKGFTQSKEEEEFSGCAALHQRLFEAARYAVAALRFFSVIEESSQRILSGFLTAIYIDLRVA